jgi:KDO2-lipid IV(A) lauroyltransferase
VALTQANPLVDRDVGNRRSRFGMKVIPRSEGTWQVLRSLQKGRAVLLFADQRVIAGEVLVDFFGIASPTARGPAVFALRTGVRVVVATIRALPGSVARYRIDLAPLTVERTADPDTDVVLLTRRYLAALENAIRDAPEQYFWVHNRWKGCATGTEPESLHAVSVHPAGTAGSGHAVETTSPGTGIGDPK